jgi:pterin-4a-carbinolamine dehydratase
MPSEARENFNLQRSSAGRYFNTSPTGEYDDRTVSSDILSNDQLNQFLKQMSAWKAHFFNGNKSKIEKFSRKFQCRNFQSALEAVNTIGLLAENSGYRLDLHVTSSSDVEIFILTQNTEGIVTLNDVELLKAMDAEITHNYST